MWGESTVYKKRKFGALFFAAILLFTVLGGCSGKSNGDQSNAVASENSNSSNEANGNGLKPYELTMALPVLGTIPNDVKKIQDAINKITQNKINTTVTLELINVGNYGQQLNLKYSSGEQLDVAFIFGQMFNAYASQGKFLDISALLKQDGQGIMEAVGQDYVNVPSVDGKLYGVPVGPIYGAGSGYFMRKDIVDKYNIDVSSIKSLDDIGRVLETVKNKEPNLIPLASSSAFNPVSAYSDTEKFAGELAVLPYDTSDFKAQSQYATQEYANRLHIVRKWFKAGYINKDAATTNELPMDMVKAGKAFSYFAPTNATSAADASISVGREMVVAELTPPHVTTDTVMTGIWTVAQQSKDPARAMMFINLLYTDKDLANLLVYGIEGEDYVKASDNIVDYPEGKSAETVGYNLLNEAFMMGNQRLLYVTKKQDPNKWDTVEEWAKNQVKSKILGFTFNSEPVKNEVVALSNVTNQYRPGLETGTIDPDKELPKFLEKLNSAGIEKYMAEVQKQLTDWVANNHK